MSHPAADWKNTYSELFQTSVEKYRQGHQQASGLVDSKGAAFLRSIGYTEQEFFDFVEDHAKAGEPSLGTSLDIAEVRHDYFLQEQKGAFSSHVISMSDLPAKDAQIEGIVWLPRLLPKAEAKLRGEMPPELMYCCGGDRRFFKERQINPAEFLRQVWHASGDHAKIVAWVKSKV